MGELFLIGLILAQQSLPMELAGSGPLAQSFLDSVNDQRKKHGLDPVQLSDTLTHVAQDRAASIAASESLDFAPRSPEAVLIEIRGAGYPAVLAQELVAVESEAVPQVVENWVQSLGSAEGFLRHEARSIGIGTAFLREQPVFVLVVAVPTSDDPNRKRLPGTAPREWLTAELFDLANRARHDSALPPFSASEPLRVESQRLAEQLLDDPVTAGVGVRTALPGYSILYYKAVGNLRAGTARTPIKLWFEQQRQVIAVRGDAMAGAGLASRGTDERLEAIWTLAVRPRH